MLILTMNYIPGREIEAIGLVKGNMVQSKHIGKDIMAGLKTVVGGELRGYSEMLTEAREEATRRMVKEAEAMGADAIISVEYTSASIMDGTAEILVYGTAVKFK